MAKEKIQKEAAPEVETVVSKSEQFYSKYKKIIWIAVAAVVVVGLLVLAYSRFIYQPACAEAQGQAYPAEQAFARGEYELALSGDGNVLGFEQIVEEYGAKAGKSVYMYAGVAALQLGRYEDAIEYLGKYNGKEPILAARAKACMGDAYVGLGEENYEKALKYYVKAAETDNSTFAAGYLLKAGILYEKLGKNEDAAGCYKSIRDDYPQSIEAYEIDKYIARVQAAE